jgi:hypothetical protein
MGDFVQVQSNQMVRIDHICVHRYEGVGRLFIKATPIDSQQPATEDPVLGSGYRPLRLATPPEETILLYGLPVILPRLLYLSLVDDRATAKEFLRIERTLQWL